MIEDLLGEKNFKIMLVDDNLVVRQLMRKRLERAGHTVDDFPDGRKAIEKINSGEDYDTIILDLQMPNISGIEVLREIRKIKSINELPVIIISSIDARSSIIEALDLGANEYLTKPIDFPIAMAKLKTTLAIKFTDSILKQQSTRSAARSKLSSLGEMASGMAHEINNPLAVVVGTSQILEKTLPKLVGEKDVEKVTKLCKRITASSQRVSTVIKYLREFAQTSFNDSLSFGSYEVNEVINQLKDISLIKAKAKQTKIEFVTDINRDVQIRIDKPKFIQALFSLVENAVDATANLENPEVLIRSSVSHEGFCIKISDNGPGVSDNILGRIYEPFFTTKEVGKGMGMGLSSAKGILESLNATLDYERISEKTVFTVIIREFRETDNQQDKKIG